MARKKVSKPEEAFTDDVFAAEPPVVSAPVEVRNELTPELIASAYAAFATNEFPKWSDLSSSEQRGFIDAAQSLYAGRAAQTAFDVTAETLLKGN